ncbi:hypothetical protein CASFOL_022036 [Castilleja foliolosa]|uniref:Uncharacterized protein n=1 Tax=Castilleja foliolosa TaxID=1961234 RepID=A0ABD3D2E8_9LAMI
MLHLSSLHLSLPISTVTYEIVSKRQINFFQKGVELNCPLREVIVAVLDVIHISDDFQRSYGRQFSNGVGRHVLLPEDVGQPLKIRVLLSNTILTPTIRACNSM